MIGLLILLEEWQRADGSRPGEAELASLRLKGTHKVSVVGRSRVGSSDRRTEWAEWDPVGPMGPIAHLDRPGRCLRVEAKPDLPDTLGLHDLHCRPIQLKRLA